MNSLNSHIAILNALHSCETINRKVNCGLTPVGPTLLRGREYILAALLRGVGGISEVDGPGEVDEMRTVTHLCLGTWYLVLPVNSRN